eukprot:TRINITY_DN9272_c0_g1_i2.p5 TRINITY_DN9272_c0_g1~~TRINITY_DN9272_c0_g1_i2.p5  ORF type:complete len:112 (-),score=18.15 TRINITY_DN9272_c0_g1_i2:67-402(-)
MIKNMESEYIPGLIKDNMMENGLKESSMVMESTLCLMDSINMDYGNMERESNGQMQYLMKIKVKTKTAKTNENFISVSYTHLTLPTKRIVQISVVGVSLKKKKGKREYIYM